MDVAAFERAITHRTRAVIPVHVFGTPCDMRALMAVAESRGIEVLEDAAEVDAKIDEVYRVEVIP
jgi:dTDP-4-amino-4,6-dideoxygalactose transaminase